VTRRTAILLTVAMGVLVLIRPTVAQNASPNLAVLDRAGMDNLQKQSVTGQLSLLWLRADPSVFDKDKPRSAPLPF
jgi:hypothetical protein